MSSTVVSFTIPAANIEKALNAINALHTDERLLADARGGSSRTTGRVREYKWYSWVRNPERDHGFTDIKDALDAWSFSGDFTEDGDFVVDECCGEKLGQEPILLKAIASFAPGLRIECVGEDGERWVWVECVGEFKELTGTVVYEESED